MLIYNLKNIFLKKIYPEIGRLNYANFRKLQIEHDTDLSIPRIFTYKFQTGITCFKFQTAEVNYMFKCLRGYINYITVEGFGRNLFAFTQENNLIVKCAFLNNY